MSESQANADTIDREASRLSFALIAWVAGVAVAMLLYWAYRPTLHELESIWSAEPDYSHGYLVIPAVLYLLWERRASRPRRISGPAWGGALLIGAAAVLRYVGATYFLSAVDGWSIPVMICGIVWLLLGRPWLIWSWPCIAFLAFMVPLPWRVETYLSVPLQHTAAVCSTWVLQCLGYAAVQEGNSILLGMTRLEVEQACSGLRMIMGVTAVAFAGLILRPLEWWQRLLIVLGIIPIALTANCVRIVITGLMYEYADGEWARRFSHDLAGWIVIPLAALILWLYDRYLRHLVVELEPVVMTKPAN